MKIRPLDIVIIALSLLAVGAFAVFAYAGGRQGTQVVVEASGRTYLYPLDRDRTEKVHGPIGDTILVISGGEAQVLDSPCRDKICVHAGKISKPGQWIACLPNKVMVHIGGGGVEKPDDVSY
jgi:hypothetical protein